MADDNKLETNRITPRDVEPDSNTPAGAARRDRDVSNDRGRSIRPDPVEVETDAGDQFGIAGGGTNDTGINKDRS
jgi:hypothetical protein